MVLVEVAFKPKRGTILPEWFKSGKEQYGTHYITMDIPIPENASNASIYVKDKLQKEYQGLRQFGEIKYRYLADSNENELSAAFGITTSIANSGIHQKPKRKLKHGHAYMQLFEPVAIPTSPSRDISLSKRVTRRGRNLSKKSVSTNAKYYSNRKRLGNIRNRSRSRSRRLARSNNSRSRSRSHNNTRRRKRERNANFIAVRNGRNNSL
jgi:hypothetical protein